MKYLTFKKTILPLCTAILLTSLVQAQIYEGDVVLQTQAEVDAFNFTSVTGDLLIYGYEDPGITSLDALSGLTEIGGRLQVLCRASNFNGLHNLVSIGGDLDISFMYVTDMTGLGSLERIGGDFEFEGSWIKNFNGLTSLREIGGRMVICGNHNYHFEDFRGLESLTTLGSLGIGSGCDTHPDFVRSLNGLSGLTTITGNLWIDGFNMMDGLRHIDLPNLNRVGGSIVIKNNPIQHLGLDKLEEVGANLTISGNSFLGDLDGLHNLNTIGWNLTITYNYLSDDNYSGWPFCGLYNLLANDGLAGSYNVSGNEMNPTIQQIIDGCPGAFDPPAIWDVSASRETICAGESSTLEIISGRLGDATDWYWYSGECGGTPVGTGLSVTVSPASTTTYFVRGEGWKIMDPVDCYEITVTVIPPPVAGSLTRTPDNDAVCEGSNVSALLTPGAGGNGTDVLEFRTCGGSGCSEWSDYTSADEISTTGLTSVEIRTKRLGGIYDDSDYAMVSWTVNGLPEPPTAMNVTVCWDGSEHSASAILSDEQKEELVWYTSSDGSITTTAPTGTDPGTYTAYAASKYVETGCESLTRTEVTLTIHPLPLPLVLSGDIIYTGETATITSSASETGIEYQLYDSNNNPVGTPATGTGSGLEWFDIPEGTGYYAIGTNLTTQCISEPSDPVDVMVKSFEVDVSESSNPAPVNSTATLKATVSPAIADIPILFKLDGDELGSAFTDENGLATFDVYFDAVGLFRIDAETACSFSAAYLPVYDPTAGFVTGGGWINSPPGAYVADNTLTGKANFSFVLKYKKGQSTPEGNTEFQFKAGNLNFKSTSYDWLIIAGTKAVFKGEGSINGVGRYGFILSTIDNKPDKFRIKIWDNNDGALVYDTMVGESDPYADPLTKLGGGSIVIHNNNKNPAKNANANPEITNLTVFPNPFSNRVYFEFISGKDADAKINIYDITGRKVETIFNNLIKKQVTYRVVFEPAAPFRDIYIYQMTLGDKVFHGKLMYKK